MPSFMDARLRIAAFNVENLFILFDHPVPVDVAQLSEDRWQRLSISTTDNKPLHQALGIARAIGDMDADILMLSEIGGRESLENFNTHFLAGAYRCCLIEGNSARGIDLGFLVKAALPCELELVSHRDRAIDFLYPHEKLSRATGYFDPTAGQIASHRFSRDVLELRLYDVGAKSERDTACDRPALVVLLAHLKSQLDRDRIDPFGRDRRKAELEMLIKIYNEISIDERTPVLVGGDFNGAAGNLATDLEFKALYRETRLQDALQLAAVPHSERFTHMQIHGFGVSRDRQLDYIFVPPQLAARVDPAATYVHRFLDHAGRRIAIPRTVAAKRLLPSDHYPVVATFCPSR